MGILNTFEKSSLGLSGETPSKVSLAKDSELLGNNLGLNGESPENVKFKGPKSSSTLGLNGITPERLNQSFVGDDFTESPLGLDGKLPDNNYLNNLPEKGIKI
tara:strand:+ start:155 stop:463 length:309 start_codon:yes stop_codon:yes gene_type:complete